ncbi:MAG: D-aminoacyl-tRNA deacylase [Acidimicrobiia bacterium]|nr:D-aminoacyl-tRNA deacylase [Acidimicrobiia bacterium]
MRALVQRVERAKVTVDGDIAGEIGPGLCVLIGVTTDDTGEKARRMAAKLWKLRIFDDVEGKMNLSVADVGGELLVVSQFTLYGDATRGNRPSYIEAARPDQAEPLIEEVVGQLIEFGAKVQSGRFRTAMKVELVNDGPVTIALEL